MNFVLIRKFIQEICVQQKLAYGKLKLASDKKEAKKAEIFIAVLKM